MSEILLQLSDLAIRSATRMLVEGVNIEVRSGAVTALMGPSGSGKTLTARAVMGQLDPGLHLVSGSLKYPVLGDQDWFAGVSEGGNRAQARLLKSSAGLRGSYMAYSPQLASSALNPGRTLGRQLEIALSRRDEAPSDPARAIREVLAEVGLDVSTAKALPAELSGGMCQRAALAVAVACQPRLVIADEPETGLDPVLTRGVTELLLQVCQQRGCGLLLISHQQETVDRIGAEVVYTRMEVGT
ncbi:MAG: ATP-binding cassette domain-containing protein [Myxococcota bacterium]|nr:ATP-binding cassette domain-containing protein [Myxococcota bacterium]